jgi:hypothetical protein
MKAKAVRRALYGKLAGDTTLNNLLGTPASGYSKAIYHQTAPDGADYPFVIFNKQAGTPTYAFKGTTGGAAFDTDVWLVKVIDRNTTADSAEDAAERLDVLLTDGVLSISGATQMLLLRQSDVVYEEVDGDQRFQHVGSLYRLLYD